MGHGYTGLGVGLCSMPSCCSNRARYCPPWFCPTSHPNTLWPGTRCTKLQTVQFRYRTDPWAWPCRAVGWHSIWPCACVNGCACMCSTCGYRTGFSGRGVRADACTHVDMILISPHPIKCMQALVLAHTCGPGLKPFHAHGQLNTPHPACNPWFTRGARLQGAGPCCMQRLQGDVSV